VRASPFPIPFRHTNGLCGFCRLVPNQTNLQVIAGLVTKYLREEFNKLGTKSRMNIDVLGEGKPWVADKDHWNYVAGQKATKVSDGFPVQPEGLFGHDDLVI
jgi:hypothetical protein